MEAQKSLTEDWSFWLLSGLALLLIGGYYFSIPPFSESESAPEWVLASLEPGSIETLRSYKKDQLLVEVTRSGDSWEITNPPGVKVDHGPVKDWAKAVASPELENKFERLADQDYGFDSPPQHVEVVTADTTHRLYLGKDQPVGQNFYLRYGSGPTDQVYVVAHSEKKRLARSLKDVRRTSLFTATSEEVDRFALYPLENGNREEGVVYDHGDTGWELTAPRKKEYSGTAARKLKSVLRGVLNLEAAEFYDSKESSFLGPVQAELVVTLHGREHTLKIGKKQAENRLVQLTGWPVVGVSTDPLEEVTKLPDLPRNWPASPE